MAPKGWEWDEKNKEWFSDYPENIELEENITRVSDWELSYRSLGQCTGAVYVWQPDVEESIWVVSVELEGPGVYVVHDCGELPRTGAEPDWDKVDALVSDAYDTVYEQCMDQALDNEEGDF